MAWYELAFALLGGILAGVINTLAGSGSLVTLPILVVLGLPATVANGTNRVGILIQCAVGVETLRREGQLRWEGTGWLIVPALLGSIVGALIAVDLSEETMNLVIGVLMAVMLVLTLVDPRQWLRQVSEPYEGRPPWWLLALFFGVGVYGGFLQAGVGVMLLVSLVMGARYAVGEANAVKLLIALCFTIPALALFAYHDLVRWGFGLLMGLGQATGAWLAARFLARDERASVWVRRLLILVILIGVGRFLIWPLYQWAVGGA